MRLRPALAMIICIAAGCSKPGTGGKAELSVTVAHHAVPIPSAIVYLKFGSREFPGPDPAMYDHSVQTGSAGHAAGHAHIKNLRHGQYYLYAEGFDSSIAQVVTGGVGVTIARKDRKNVLDVQVPVTE